MNTNTNAYSWIGSVPAHVVLRRSDPVALCGATKADGRLFTPTEGMGWMYVPCPKCVDHLALREVKRENRKTRRRKG